MTRAELERLWKLKAEIIAHEKRGRKNSPRHQFFA